MTWSYSRVSSFADCRYKWFLTYLYRDENGNHLKRKSGFFAEFGSYMHLILQLCFTGVLAKKDLSTFYLTHFKDNVRSKAPNQKIYQNYFEQGFRYLELFSFPKRTILGVEEKSDFVFAGKPFTGFIDVVSDDGRLIITDHKSRTLKARSKRSMPTKADEELDKFLRQLYVYSAAVKDKYGKFPDLLEFNCFRSQQVIQEPFDLQKYYEVETWAADEIETITVNEDWTGEPEYWRCNFLCDVCKECEYKSMSGKG